MATLHANNLQLQIGFHSLSKYNTLNYYLRLVWEGQPLINPAILSNNQKDDNFIFTLTLDENEDLLISFFSKLLEQRGDTNLYNQVEPDIKILVHTWQSQIPMLKHKYGETINVDVGPEPFESGIQKLTQKHGNNIELVLKLPNSFFKGGGDLRENWIQYQYVDITLKSDFTAIEKLYSELLQEWAAFKNKYPEHKMIEGEYLDAFR